MEIEGGNLKSLIRINDVILVNNQKETKANAMAHDLRATDNYICLF